MDPMGGVPSCNYPCPHQNQNPHKTIVLKHMGVSTSWKFHFLVVTLCGQIGAIFKILMFFYLHPQIPRLRPSVTQGGIPSWHGVAMVRDGGGVGGMGILRIKKLFKRLVEQIILAITRRSWLHRAKSTQKLQANKHVAVSLLFFTIGGA